MTKRTLGKYELLEELGRGGFGTVYRARDTVLDVERAVKVLHPALVADRAFIERFKREAQFAARLKHPHIVPVYDLGESEGRFYLAMEYMPGGSLKDLLAKESRLPFERAVEITRQIAEALDHIHSHNLIHRDIKPGNILFDEQGNAALTDLGFAKALSGAGSASLSSSGGIIGTPSYIPPEVWRGKEVTPATDVYSLACVFYEMVTGEVLFSGDSPPEVMTKHVLDGPQFQPVWPEGIPARVEGILRKALSVKPEDRPANMIAFAHYLEDLLPGQKMTAQLTASRNPALPHTHAPETNLPEEKRASSILEAASSSTGANTERIKVERTMRHAIPKRVEPASGFSLKWKALGGMALGWVISGALGWVLIIILSGGIRGLFPFALSWYLVQPISWSLSGAIGGLVTGLTLRKENPRIDWKFVIWMTLGWAISIAIGFTLVEALVRIFNYTLSWTLGWTLGWAIGGFVTGLTLRKENPRLDWKFGLWMTLSWTLGVAFGLVIFFDYEITYVISLGISSSLGWAIGWTISGSAKIRRLRRV